LGITRNSDSRQPKTSSTQASRERLTSSKSSSKGKGILVDLVGMSSRATVSIRGGSLLQNGLEAVNCVTDATESGEGLFEPLQLCRHGSCRLPPSPEPGDRHSCEMAVDDAANVA